MERILTVGDVSQRRLLFQVLFYGLRVKRQNKLANGRTVYKTYKGARQKWRFPTLKSLSLQSYGFTFFRRSVILPVGRSLIIAKRPLIYPFESVSRFHRLLNFSSLLHYSTQPKPSQKFDKSAKGLKDLDHSMERYDGVAKSWPLPPSPVTEQPRISVRGATVAEQDPATSVSSDAKMTQLPDEAASGATNLTENTDVVESEERKPGIFKRFHQTYKQYGKVLVAVHIFTSSVWTGIFYVTAMSGVNVEPFLRWVGASDTILSFYTMPGVGHLAVAYLMYKLATPARYAVTIGGTHMAVKWLTQWGYVKPIPESNNLKSLVKDGRTKVKAKYEKYQDRIDDIRDELKEFASKENKTK